MSWANADFLRRIGLATQGNALPSASGRGRKKPITLTGAATDPQTGLVVSLVSQTDFDDKGNLHDITLKYWRHLPYGKSQDENLIRIRMKPAKGEPGQVELDQVWVQAHNVYDSEEGGSLTGAELDKKINRVLGAVNRLNTHLRENGDIADVAKILADSYLHETIGEEVIVRGLSKKGGFEFSLAPYFMKQASAGVNEPLNFKKIDETLLKTILGFRINTLERDKDFSSSRTVSDIDPQSGVEYQASVDLKETKKEIVMDMTISPTENSPEDVAAKAIPELLKFRFSKNKDKSFTLEEAKFLGQPVKPSDSKAVLALLGMAQHSNGSFANWKYPAFMDSTYEFDMADMISPLQTPPKLEDGGEFLYGSLHGRGFEKKIENFGDQIGIADIFLHRGLKDDGSLSTIGVAVDFPFASGGPDSNFDGAVPDFLPFLDKIDHICITHDHYDHCDGLTYYAKAGMLRGKTVHATPRVAQILRHKMEALKVDKNLLPKIEPVDKDGAFPVYDEDKNVRMWVQYSPNAVIHSALCTPYLVTGCYNDDFYNGSALVYGDGRGLTQKGKDFFAQGTRLLPDQATQYGHTVTPEKVDKDITVVMHDLTAIRYEGHSPEPKEVEDNLCEIADWFSDKGILMTPISTNDAEYTAGIHLAHRSGRDITAVGRNAEIRVSTKNLYGVLPDLDLSTVKIDPAEELEKYKNGEEPLIPGDILELYFETIHSADSILSEKKDDEDFTYEDALKAAKEKARDAVKELLPPSERDHEKDVRIYIWDSLLKHGAVVFNNDMNDYLRYLAILERNETSSIRATRTSKIARSFRDIPSKLLIFITGTQGNSEEKFSTLQKFKNFFSLLDADEKYRKTGYKINAEDFVVFVTQSAIPGNENSQEAMIRDLIRARDVTVVGAFRGGFKVYNPKDKRDLIVRELNAKGHKYETDIEGNIRVYNVPIHIHGHGFQEDLMDIVKAIPAESHEAHHIPDHDSYDVFRNLMKERGLNHSDETPDDFQVARIDGNAANKDDKFKLVAQLNPSYVMVRMVRKYGQFFGGFLQMVRKTLLRREGENREDGLAVRSPSGGTFEKVTAGRDWNLVSNPNNRDIPARIRRQGPSEADQTTEERTPRSRPRFDFWPTKPVIKDELSPN